VSVQNDNIITNSSFDSLVGDWKYLYDYRLTTTVANPDVVIDSLFGNSDFTPFSYMKINSDSSFKWYRTERKILPAIGGGFSGKLVFSEPSRVMNLWAEKETSDDFATISQIHNPPVLNLTYRIKYLSNDSMVLIMRLQPTPPGNIYYLWCDVFKR
jgi:hypothetical protein